MNPDRVLTEDPDFDRSSFFFASVCQILRIDADRAWLFFKPTAKDFTPWKNRLHFCALCIERDIAQGRLPSWRKSWCYSFSINCAEHMVELSIGSVRPSLAKAWNCFSEFIQQEKSIQRWDAPLFLRLRACVANRLCRWLINYRRNTSIGSLCNFLEALYILSLKVLTFHHPAGYAIYLAGYKKRRHASVNAELYDILLEGPGESLPRERFIALLIAGWILDLIPDGEMALVIKKLRSVGVEFPNNPYLFGYEFLKLFTVQEYLDVGRLFGTVGDEIPHNFRLFLNGFERSISVQVRIEPGIKRIITL
ncbi:hypothetical protein QZH45_16205 [Pseudomonas corrugata]|uniref:hypothetical protein n=1 Tax=Pseudomonas corrugata TaxID=47879 RepID=UPI003D815CD0